MPPILPHVALERDMRNSITRTMRGPPMPSITESSLREIKERTDILTVAGRFTFLKRSGVEHVGLCPYPDHDEKSPSFSVSPGKGVYLCRGCERGGDAITLVRDLSGLDFTEAVEFLADIVGVEVEYDSNSAKDQTERRSRRSSPQRPRSAKTASKPKKPKVKRTRLCVQKTTRWKICDAAGQHVATHVREDGIYRVQNLETGEVTEEKGKDLKWWRPAENGKLVPGLDGLPLSALPLYRSEYVHTFPRDKTVWLCEGEKDTDALVRMGFCAVGTATGASKCPSQTLLEVLSGFDVTFWRDDDEPGLKHAVQVGKTLTGIAKKFGVVCHPVEGVKGAGAADHPAIVAEIKRRQSAAKGAG